jgi:hypothetical protein
MANIGNTTETGNPVVGEVIVVHGTVKAISPDGAERALAPNSPVYAFDQIVTDNDGSASILLEGTPPTQLDLDRMSHVLVDEDVFAGVTPATVADVAAALRQVQDALVPGDLPIGPDTASGDYSSGAGYAADFSLDVNGGDTGTGFDAYHVTLDHLIGHLDDLT